MKDIFKLKSMLVFLVILTSCNQDIDNFYDEKARIQFKYFNEVTGSDKVTRRTYSDRITYSFGMKDETVERDTARIVVEFLGNVSNLDRNYQVRIVADSTTAVEGLHYEPISATQIFRAGRMKDTLKIVVKRKALSSSFSNPEDKRLMLEMVPTADFNLGMKDGLRTKLYINNYLSEPIWWKDPGRSTLQFYHPKKWKILISFNQKFSDPQKCEFDYNNQGRSYFQGLASYLSVVPTFDDETGGRIYIDRIVPKP
ncbi:protein of unknown function [Pedobacter africanus]|uniref:DUF4843 domain-containing protein n=2 Tax=Pedobacter africanus TaxID=151894 RepID=A0A1W2DX91_9SPHI|nr:protein of unknown function [Pedobacter africanus]